MYIVFFCGDVGGGGDGGGSQGDGGGGVFLLMLMVVMLERDNLINFDFFRGKMLSCVCSRTRWIRL